MRGTMREEDDRRSVRDVEERGGTTVTGERRVIRDLVSRTSLTARRQRMRRRRRKPEESGGGGGALLQQRSGHDAEHVHENEDDDDEEEEERDKQVPSMGHCDIVRLLGPRLSDEGEDAVRSDAANTSNESSFAHADTQNEHGENNATPSPHEDMLDILERMKRRCEEEIPGGNRSNMARACREAIRVHARSLLGDEAWCFDAFLGFS